MAGRVLTERWPSLNPLRNRDDTSEATTISFPIGTAAIPDNDAISSTIYLDEGTGRFRPTKNRKDERFTSVGVSTHFYLTLPR